MTNDITADRFYTEYADRLEQLGLIHDLATGEIMDEDTGEVVGIVHNGYELDCLIHEIEEG